MPQIPLTPTGEVLKRFSLYETLFYVLLLGVCGWAIYRTFWSPMNIAGKWGTADKKMQVDITVDGNDGAVRPVDSQIDMAFAFTFTARKSGDVHGGALSAGLDRFVVGKDDGVMALKFYSSRDPSRTVILYRISDVL